MRFTEFLINEAKMVTVDAEDANAVQQVKKAASMDADRLATKRAVDARTEKQTIGQTTERDDPAGRLKRTRAAKAAELAMLDKKIAQMEKQATR